MFACSLHKHDLVHDNHKEVLPSPTYNKGNITSAMCTSVGSEQYHHGYVTSAGRWNQAKLTTASDWSSHCLLGGQIQFRTSEIGEGKERVIGEGVIAATAANLEVDGASPQISVSVHQSHSLPCGRNGYLCPVMGAVLLAHHSLHGELDYLTAAAHGIVSKKHGKSSGEMKCYFCSLCTNISRPGSFW